MKTFRILTYTALISLAACVSAPAEVIATRAVQIDEICVNVMHFAPGEAHFMGCQESLRRTVAKLDAADARVRAVESCGAEGLQTGTPAFATCVLDRSRGASPVPTQVSQQ